MLEVTADSFPFSWGTTASFATDSLQSQKSPERTDSFGHHRKEDLNVSLLSYS